MSGRLERAERLTLLAERLQEEERRRKTAGERSLPDGRRSSPCSARPNRAGGSGIAFPLPSDRNRRRKGAYGVMTYRTHIKTIHFRRAAAALASALLLSVFPLTLSGCSCAPSSSSSGESRTADEAVSSTPAAEKIRFLLIDTDIGNDIDDTLALALALNTPEAAIVGITTVYVQPEKRADIARGLTALYGRPDIPVAAGAGAPRKGTWPASYGPSYGTAAAGNAGKASETAVERILRAADETDGLTIVAIGPLTNIAAALTERPALASQAKLILMGGRAADNGEAEWNFACDPEAARIVLSSGMDITLIGLDVTERCPMTLKITTALGRAESAPAKELTRLVARFTAENGKPFLHDPLAMAEALNPGLVRLEPMALTVAEDGRLLPAGKGAAPNVRAAVDGELTAFLSYFQETICR